MVTKQLNKTQSGAMPNLKIKVRVSRHIELDDDTYLAFCPEFGVSTEGDTIAEAEANLDDALEALFELADINEILHRLTCDLTASLENWELTAKKDEFEKSRQRALHAIVTALFEALQSKNGVAKNSKHSTGALQFQHEIANAPA